MIRKYPLFLFVFLFTEVVNGQTNFHFADSTAQWNELEGVWTGNPPNYVNYYTTTFTANTDTVINAINYQIIISDNDEVYLRRDSLNRVYAHYGNSISDSFENLLYDFSKQTGDTFNMYGWMTVIVTSTDTVFWGKPRKRMMIEQGDTISPVNPYVCVEGIGMLNSYFLLPMYPRIPESFDPNVLCFIEHDSMLYHDTAFNSCDVETGITGLEQVGISVDPNPATENYVDVQLSQNPSRSINFALYDITDRMILQKPLSNQTNRIDLLNINPGIYLYSITSRQQAIGKGKLIVE